MTDWWTFVFHILEIPDCMLGPELLLSSVHPAKYWSAFIAALSTTYLNFHRRSCILCIVSYCRWCFHECGSFIPATFQAHIWETPVFNYAVCILFSLPWYDIGTFCHSHFQWALQLTLCVDKRRNVCGFDTWFGKSIFSSFLQNCWPCLVRSLIHGLYHSCTASTRCCCCVVSIHELVINNNWNDCLTYHAPLCGVSAAVRQAGGGGVCIC
jgi:hypothetical protein